MRKTDIEKAIVKFAEQEKREAEKAVEEERNQISIAPNSYIAKEIKYQTALLHQILNGQQKLTYEIAHKSNDNGKKNSPLSKLMLFIRRKRR